MAREPRQRVVDLLAEYCKAQGIRSVYAVSGGGCGVLYSALVDSGLSVVHCRREEACVYAALEESLAADRPALASVTNGEAVANAASAIASARTEGGRLLLLSASSNPEQFGRLSIQPTDLESMPLDFYRPGPLFDCARLVSDPDELPWLLNRLSVGFQRPNGFVAHLSLPRKLQQALVARRELPALRVAAPAPAPQAIDYCAEALGVESFAVLVGFGARHHARHVRALLALTGAPAFTTPRAKGTIVAPTIGLGNTLDYYPRGRPARLLVLGSRLGEASCGWDEGLLPRSELVHVDVDPSCFGQAYAFPTYGVQAEVGLFLQALLQALAARPGLLLRAEGA